MFKRQKKGEKHASMPIEALSSANIEAVGSFAAEFEKCTRVRAGRIEVDQECVRRIVRANRDGASAFAASSCDMALAVYARERGKSEPDSSLIMSAMIVAVAYEREFDDDALANLVHKHAVVLGMEDQVRGIRG